MPYRTARHRARQTAAAAVVAAAFGLTACQDTGNDAAGAESSAASGSHDAGSQHPGSAAGSAKSGSGAAESLRKKTVTPLRDGAALYPRAIRLEHSGDRSGRVLASSVVHDGGDGVGTIQESTDDGASNDA
ncbi:hypothetical protein TPA0910_31930 [Streptomyces hygroscopicus subsp. sporocinereus]|uniref:Lipoprotein n=1 Tax=Streptomyces hygroscopicus TaxID=1912 RepID=A0ABQ3TZE8_STRHY|nr:hypothetical protein [Streptomyces hygroscopicus]GHJ28760.1 hypothetical protein TPA0910_31930 [Streptomyces hygroscopicus]